MSIDKSTKKAIITLKDRVIAAIGKQSLSTAIAIFLSATIVAQVKPALPIGYGRQHIASCIVGETDMANFRHFFVQSDGTIQSWKAGGTFETVAGIDEVIALAEGDQHILALKRDGTVWAWGNNGNAALGNLHLSKASKNSTTPAQVDNLTDIIAISCLNAGNFALKRDGTVWAWGAGCGLAEKRERYAYVQPVQVPGISNAVAIAGSMALLADGTVVAWGGGSYGRLGNGTKTSSDVPVKVKGLSNVKQITARDAGALALLRDGTVWAWGNNLKGYLGNGVSYTTQDDHSAVPIQIKSLTNVVAIDADAICLALLKDGTVKVWGWGATGGMGLRADEVNATPRTVPGISKAMAIKAGSGTGFAILADGTVMGWGANLTTNKFHGVSYGAIKITKLTLP